MGALRELLASFHVEVDDHQLKEAQKSIGGMLETLKDAGKAFAAAFAVHEISEFIGSTIEAAARTGDLSERLGVSAHDLQAFQLAAGLAGVEGEEAAHSLGLLSKNVGEALHGGGEAAKVFAGLHVSLRDAHGAARPLTDVLLDVADSFERLPDQQTRAAAAMQVFGRAGQSLIPVLGKGREELAKTLAEFDKLGGGMSGEFVASAKAADDEGKRLSVAWLGLKSTLIADLLPAVSRIVGGFERFVVATREALVRTHVLQDALKLMAAGAVVAGIWKIVTAVRALTAAEFAAAAPWTLVAAGILGVYFAFDELRTALAGGDTILGRFLDRWGEVGAKSKFVDALRDAVKSTEEAVQELGEVAAEVGNVFGISFGGNASGMLQQLARQAVTFMQLLETGAKNLKAMADGMNALVHADFKGVLSAFKESSGGKELAEGPSDPMRHALEHFMPKGLIPGGAPMPDVQAPYVGRTASVPIPMGLGVGAGPAGNPVSLNQVNNTQIDVHTTSDNPRAVGDAVGAGVATQRQRDNERARTALRLP